jgi:hypothetical protein
MKYQIEPTRNTPFVNFDYELGLLELKGISSPENSLEFYNPVFKAVDNYTTTDNNFLEVNMALEYFNTSSSKCIYQIFKGIKRLRENGREIIINWMYDADDEDMKEVGEDYSDILGLDFNYMELDF